MITLYLWQLRWRMLILPFICLAFYLIEPSFHAHAAPGSADYVAPDEMAFTMANVAALCMLVLLTDFVSGDRRRGFYRIYFAHPTRPLAFYAVRWLVAYAVTMAVIVLFFVTTQLAAWGELRAGAGTLVQPALFALVYGALVAFFSVCLPIMDGLVAFMCYWATVIWNWWLDIFDQTGLEAPIPHLVRQGVSFILPPHLALNDAYTQAHAGLSPWAPVSFVIGYALFWLAAAGLLLWSREWP